MVKISKLKERRERDLFSVKSHNGVKKRNKLNKNKIKLRKKLNSSDQLEIEFGKRKKIGDAEDIDYLSYENISEGQVILGCVAEVRQYELIVSLPHKLAGSVPITNISNAYKEQLSKLANGQDINEEIHSLEELFPVGHFIITRVKSVAAINDTHRVKVTLSVMPGDVNFGVTTYALKEGSLLQCSVQSVEDHGYVLDAGIPNLRSAFLSKKGVPKSLGTVGIGSVMLCAVSDIEYDEEDPDKNVRIKVTAKNKHIAHSALQLTSETSVDMLLPGTLLDAFVEKVNEFSVEISSEFLKGIVSSDHLSCSSHMPSDYKIGQSVQARILYVANFTNLIHFTLNPNICSSRVIMNPHQGMTIGTVVNKAKIVKNDKHGVYLQLPEDNLGFCSTYHLKDTPMITSIKRQKEFPVGAIKCCRIVQYSLMDQLCIVSLKKSVISDQVVGKMELKVGQVVDVAIKSHSSGGATVALGRNISGFVPRRHLTDSNMKDPESKLPPAHKCKARILRNDPNDRGPILTLKSIIINSELPIVQDFDDSNIGVITEGMISKIYDKSLLIELYGEAKGMLPVEKMSVSESDVLSDIYKEGQVLRCKVVSCNEKKKHITLSMKFNADSQSPTENFDIKNKLKLGDIMNGTVKSVEDSKVIVSVDNAKKGFEYVIPVFQLADDLKLCESLIKCLKTGDKIIGAIVYYIDKASILLSLKPTIFNLSVNLKNKQSKRIDDLKEGEVVPSVVTEVSPDMLTVSLMKGLLGIKRHLYKADFVRETVDDLTKASVSQGQALLVKCIKLNQNGHPRLSSCWDEIESGNGLSSLQLLYNTLIFENLLKSAYKSQMGDLEKFSDIRIGNLYEAKVVYKCKEGVLVNILDLNIDGIIHPSHFDPSVSHERGSTLGVRVLHVNCKYQFLEVTSKKNIKKLFIKRKHNLQVGQLCTCEVLLAKQEFILCRLKSDCVGQVVYLPSKRHVNDFKGRQSYYEIGKKIKIIIRFIKDAMVLADFHCHCTDSETANATLMEELPKITFKKVKSEQLLTTLAKNKESYTSFDFIQKAVHKIQEVNKVCNIKKKQFKANLLTYQQKLKILKKDNFSQFDDSLYWWSVIVERKNRKKLKKHGLLPRSQKNSGKKRLNSETSDACENNVKRYKADNFDNSIEDIERSTTESEPCLQLNSKGFVWEPDNNDKNNEREDSSSEDEVIQEDQKKVKKLSKEEKLQKKLEKEQRLRELELQRKDPNRPLESALDYEELLQKNSSSSVAWVQYISFYLACAEADKARAVAQRALKAIPPTKEEDRLVIWSSILRMEVLFGTNETVKTSFNEAVVTNDELKIYQEMARIYADANKMKEADDIFEKMIKKYSKSLDVWKDILQFNFKNNRLKVARDLMNKALEVLPKQDHVELINRFAQLEFRFGEAEKGKTMFEKTLINFPKRIDIWIVYADLLTKNNDIEGARNVYERMTNLNLRTKQMRTVFKKLLSFEQKHGNPHTVQQVKSRIEDYVMTALDEND